MGTVEQDELQHDIDTAMTHLAEMTEKEHQEVAFDKILSLALSQDASAVDALIECLTEGDKRVAKAFVHLLVVSAPHTVASDNTMSGAARKLTEEIYAEYSR